MLTVDQLKAMEPGSIFAIGEEDDVPEGLFMANTGKRLKWVAVRGGIHDWAIYCHLAEHSVEWIKERGDKVHDERHVKKLVPCDDEAFKMYRH